MSRRTLAPRAWPTLVAAALLVAAPEALASPATEVASAFDEGDRFDIHLHLDYRFVARRAAIKREFVGLSGTDPDGPMPLVKDLVYSSSRQEIIPRLEVGVFTDVALTLAMPIIFGQSATLAFDQRADNCVFPTDPGTANCIDATNSSTVLDGLVPASGFNAQDPSGGFVDGSANLFRGPRRSGIDQLHLGAVWAPMNQLRDDTKPTWKIGAELRASVGKVMTFDRDDLDGSDGVSRGVHEVRLHTSMARRIGWAEPFFEIYWLGPIGSRGGAPLESPERPFGAQQTTAQQHAGGRFGVQADIWQGRSPQHRVALHLSGMVDAAFEGRAYTDMWEVFAYAGHAPSGDSPLALDSDPVADGQQTISHPGVSNVENYLRLGSRAAFAAYIGRHVRLDLGVDLGWEQSHLISFADPGTDGSDSNDIVDPNSAEVNPLHAPLIDTVGHRYRADEVFNIAGIGSLRVLF